MVAQARSNSSVVSTERRSPLIIAFTIALTTVLLASITATGQSASQSGVSPSVADAAITEAGRARQVAAFAAKWQSDIDPLITRNGVQVKSSNYEGVLIGGQRYYYSLAPHPSFDPLSRGDVNRDQIVIKDRIQLERDFLITVYTIPR